MFVSCLLGLAHLLYPLWPFCIRLSYVHNNRNILWCHQLALAKMTPHSLVRARWSVRSWVMVSINHPIWSVFPVDIYIYIYKTLEFGFIMDREFTCAVLGSKDTSFRVLDPCRTGCVMLWFFKNCSCRRVIPILVLVPVTVSMLPQCYLSLS